MIPRLGRPREFKCKMRDELVNHVARGATVAEAAQIVGVSLRTVQREARHNQHFHHDLELAKHSAPTDLEQQMQQAARTHWRAAAWLLERKDPDRYAKRPANSCSPAMLQDACDFLIEKALEATPAEHREAVYRHIATAADQIYEVIMPDRSVERRCLASALSKQTTPLSCTIESKLLEDPDYARQQRRNQDLARRPWRQVERLLGTKRSEETVEGRPTSRWQPSNGKRLDSEDMDAAWRYPTPEEEDACRQARRAAGLHERARRGAGAAPRPLGRGAGSKAEGEGEEKSVGPQRGCSRERRAYRSYANRAAFRLRTLRIVRQRRFVRHQRRMSRRARGSPRGNYVAKNVLSRQNSGDKMRGDKIIRRGTSGRSE